MQKVDLLNISPNILKTIYTACRTCYSDENPIDIWENATENKDCTILHKQKDGSYITQDEKMQKLVKKVIESGHTSTTEHSYFTFSISGVSRACTHQLVRNRHASFSQKSQRYVKEEGQFDYVVPESIKNAGFSYEYNEFMKETQKFYTQLVEADIPPEDARAVLPNAATSSMVMSINLRSLIHFCSLRMCSNAQDEIREVANKMAELVTEKEPWLADYLAPKCKGLGYCDEIRPCGIVRTKAEVLG